MDMCVAVVGGGSWGTTVGSLAAHNAPTVLWARDPETAASINERNENTRYLPGLQLHPDLTATDDLAAAVRQADVLVMGVPSHAMRSTAQAVSQHLRAWVPVISLAKGLEQSTMQRMTQVLAEELPDHPMGVLTGPNLAKEVLNGYAAAAVVAMPDAALAQRLQRLFHTEVFRVYTNDDVIGAELGGAFKNVIALASGMADGLGTGDNTRAAVVTRGLAEVTRLGVAMGGRPETFAGLAGMGDLVATCISSQSRNRFFGQRLGEGLTVAETAAEMDQVAEGVKSAPVVVELARRHGVEMPIAEAVNQVVSHGAPAGVAYSGLLRREVSPE